MITTSVIFIIAHDGNYYKVEYSIATSTTTLSRGGGTVQDNYFLIAQRTLVCDTRTKAETMLHNYIKQFSVK